MLSGGACDVLGLEEEDLILEEGRANFREGGITELRQSDSIDLSSQRPRRSLAQRWYRTIAPIYRRTEYRRICVMPLGAFLPALRPALFHALPQSPSPLPRHSHPHLFCARLCHT